MLSRDDFLKLIVAEIEALSTVDGTHPELPADSTPVPVGLIRTRADNGRCVVVRGGAGSERLGLSEKLGVHDLEVNVEIHLKSRKRFYKMQDQITQHFHNASTSDYTRAVVIFSSDAESDLVDEGVQCVITIDFTIVA